MKTVHVQYFALLREQRGLSREAVPTSAATAGDLYHELKTRHALTLEPSQLRVAVNGEFAAWTTPLSEGAQLVFIPPVAGG